MVDHHRFKDTSNKLQKEKQMETSQQLADILTKYAVPDKNIVGKLPRGGTQLDFVGHADITKSLSRLTRCGHGNHAVGTMVDQQSPL